MYTRITISRLNALFALVTIVAITLLVTQAISHSSSAQAQEAPQSLQTQWEYKAIQLGVLSSGDPSTSDKLNKEVPELQWEFIDATDGWVIFRRPVRRIQ